MKKQKQDKSRLKAPEEMKTPRSSSIGTPDPIAMRKLLNLLYRHKQERLRKESKEKES